MPGKYRGKRTYKKKLMVKAKPKAPFSTTQYKALKKVIKRQANKQIETKNVDNSSTEQQLYHNYWTGSMFENLTGQAQLPAQGTGESQRVGNEVTVVGTKLYLQVLLKNDRLNSKVRIIIVKHNPAYGKSVYTDWFDNVMNVAVDPIDRGRAKVVYDRLIGYKNFNPTNSTDEVVIFRKIWIPIKEKYKFRDDGSQNLHYAKNIYSIIAMAYDSSGSLTTDNIASVKWFSRLYYKDA